MARTWQWIDNHHGPMGWFSHRDKRQHEGQPAFTNGTWRAVSAEEVARNRATDSRLYYEQS